MCRSFIYPLLFLCVRRAHIIIAKCNKSSRNQKFKLAQGPNGDIVLEPGRKSNLRVVGIRDDKENRAWLRLAGKNSEDASNIVSLGDGKMAIDELIVSSQGMKVDYGEPVMAIDSSLLDAHVAAPRSELIYKWDICSPLEEYDYCKYQSQCCPTGTKCYVKWEVWSGCLKSCTPGMTDGFDNVPWKCDLDTQEVLNPEPTDPSVVGLLTELSGGSGLFDQDPDNFNLFLALVEEAGLTSSLDEGGLQDITVLAPNDEGFYKAAQEFGYSGDYNEKAIFMYLVAVVDSLPAEGTSTLAEKLKFPLTYHVILEPLSFEELADTDGKEVFTLCDCPITFDLEEKEKLAVRDVAKPYPTIIYDQSDIMTSNGYVQVINRMLVPIIPASA